MLRVMTYNILDGGSGREPLLAEVLHAVRPDVATLQEVVPNGLVEALAGGLGMAYHVAAGNSTRQMALLSRLPILAARSYAPYPPIRHVILEAELAHPACSLRVFGVHLKPRYTLANEAWRAWETQVLLRQVRPHLGRSCLVMGDFNTAAPGDPVKFERTPSLRAALFRLQGRGKVRLAIRQVLAAGLVDCFRRLHPGDPGYTLPPPDPGVRLDYIFASEPLAGRLARCSVVLDVPAVPKASDHYPVVAEFAV